MLGNALGVLQTAEPVPRKLLLEETSLSETRTREISTTYPSQGSLRVNRSFRVDPFRGGQTES